MAEGRGPPGQYTHLARTTFQLHIDSSNGNKLDLTNSNSNLSTASSDNLEQDPEFVKRRVNSGGSNSKKMGKFASRATQFFETIGRKTGKKLGFMGNSTFSLYSTKDKSTSSESSQTTPTVSPQDVVFPEIDVKGRILAFSPPAKKRVKHQGYLNIFSSFNKRRWGKRWCLVTENMFECYQNETCKVLELDFLLRNCVLRRAVTETKSEYGLMLTEKNSEKITVEPLSKEDFPGWLWVFMKESATDSIPEGLEDYWEEQPYDVIHSDDLNHSAWSDMIGYSSIEMNSPKLHNMSMTRDEESHYELDEETETDSVSESRPLVDQKHQARDSGIAAESTDESIMPSDEQNASCSGELYTPVRRKSNVNIGSLQKKDILSEKELLLQKRNVVVLTDKDHLKSDSATKSTGDKSPHSQTDAHSDGSFVAELLTHFERFQSQIETTDSDSENKVDTAYSSGMSENNSSGGESRTDCASVRHSAADVEDEVDTTDHPADVEDEVDTTGHLVTPIDNVDVTNAISKKSESPYEQIKNPNDNPQIPNVPERNLSDHNADRTVNESADRTVKTVESENVERKNNLNSPRPESHPSTNEDSLDSVNTSRNSYTDENSHDKKSENLALSISQKIEGLRTKLVDLKKKRISTRMRRLVAVDEIDIQNLDQEYLKLMEYSQNISEEIKFLTEDEKLANGSFNAKLRNHMLSLLQTVKTSS